MTDSHDLEQNSRRLAYLLRHSRSISRQKGGWVDLKDAMHHSGLTLPTIQAIVESDRKGRFQLDAQTQRVRALYGHSAPVEMDYEAAAVPERLFHGTSAEALPLILQQGLTARSRQYVHLTDAPALAAETGSRHGEPVIVSIDARQMHRDGYTFHHPAPHLWLIPTVPAKYLLPDNIRT